MSKDSKEQSDEENALEAQEEEFICGACKEPYSEPNDFDGFCSYDCLRNFNLE